MRLAVVIPLYNHERYVVRAIQSCLDQTRRPDRILVLDDGSKDGSVAAARQFEPQGVEVHTQENANAFNTINRLVAMAAADCDAVSILNSDDHYEPQRFEKCLPLLEQQPETDVVCTALNIIDAEDRPVDPGVARAKWFRAIWSPARGGESPDPVEWLGLANFPATTSNVISRTALLQRFPFRPYHFNHDYYFLAQSVLRGKLTLLNEPLCNYRIHTGNTINTSPAPLMREMLRMHLDLWRDLAPELRTDAALRGRFMRYAAALWTNVSSFHAGIFNVLLAQTAAEKSYDELLALVKALDETDFPELTAYPNRALVNEWTEAGPLSPEHGLAHRHESLRSELKETKAALKAQKEELKRLRTELRGSRWLRWGRKLGVSSARRLAGE